MTLRVTANAIYRSTPDHKIIGLMLKSISLEIQKKSYIRNIGTGRVGVDSLIYWMGTGDGASRVICWHRCAF